MSRSSSGEGDFFYSLNVYIGCALLFCMPGLNAILGSKETLEI